MEKMTFNIDWRRYIGSLGVAESVDYAIVMQPEFIAIVDRMFEDYPLQYWKEYSRWKLLQFSAPYLSRAFRDQHFDFYQKTLFGTPKQQPRWKIVQNVMDDQIGQPLGQLYVSEYFPPQHKERMLGLIENLRTAFDSRILRNSWMSEQTKNAARLKLKKMGVKIGYPDKWIDYSKLEVSPEDYLGNVMRSETFNNSRNFKRVGETLDPYDWGLTPPTVNAYYSATRNEIVFPAGILNPPFFYPQGDDASNYGSAGVVIGHEITHGFDDKGSLYDAEGNLKSWWTVEDREKFDALAGKIEAQFNGYTVLDTIPINGKLTLGENIGDLGGLAIAFEAMKINQRQNGSKVIDGLSDEQRFFIAYAKMWRIKYRDAVLTEQVKVDPHAPGYYRANGTLSNFQEFFRAFKIPEGSAMRRKEVIEIW
jgi:predicted metalloendopeptidase